MAPAFSTLTSALRFPKDMTISLIQQYYRTPDPGRQEELDSCLKHNLENDLVTRIHLLTEEEIDLTAFPHRHKVTQRVIGERLSFRDAFTYANGADPEGAERWVLANADIWFDESLSALADADFDRVMFALTRHETRADGSLELMVSEFAHGSQDAWVFRTPVPVDRMYTAFCLGVPGCDNRLAHEFIAAGYKVLNPSLRIIAHHLDLARSTDIFQRDDIYRGLQTAGDTPSNRFVAPPHQFHIFPVEETDPDAFEVYRIHLQHLSEQYARICRQAEQIADQGRVMAELYNEIERQSAECERLRSSWSWRITSPLRKLHTLMARPRRGTGADRRA